MHRAKKPSITDLNQHLTCKLCQGYFIDATTIIECLHSFCRSCIVKYLETNKYCPVCDVQVHKTKPLLNVRADKTLQDIVYKLVPRLLQNEVQRRRDFYLANPEAKANLDRIEEDYQHIVTSDETVSLILRYYGCKGLVRYLRCPAAVSVGHLQKLIRAKYGLFDNHHVDILYNQDCLNSSLTMMDVAYIYSWKRKAPIELSYRIYQYAAKKLKLEEERKEEKVEVTQTNNNNWKEVQLRISENGEMSIIQDEALELVNNNNYKPEIVTVVDTKVTKKELPELKFIGKCVVTLPEQISATTSCASLSSTTTKTVYSTINSSKCSVSSDSDTKKMEDDKKIETSKANDEPVKNSTEKGVKRKLDLTNEQPIKQQKQTILNHSIGLHNLSNNHPLKKHSLNKPEAPAEKPEEIVFSKPNIINRSFPSVPLNRPGTPKPASKPCYMPKPVINVPKPSTSVGGAKTEVKAQPTCASATKTETKPVATTASTNQIQNKLIKSKASTPIGYKTLRDPPKSWNSQIAKANINKPLTDPKYGDLKNVRPAKFFKMRNNLPRYLGNPASGVKPMYQVHVSPEKEKDKPQEAAAVKGEIKKHSIVKIDPKTLKPISEKAPETASLSNSSDLKINTSSVSIFNPLKLQNSPKGDRKSPKSPHSPKAKGASPPGKRDKLSLNFTPSNPFIPNLASPTVNPNQFLYPSGPPGFPSYDPR
ncbi:polycomb complex protein BMI-1-A, partial [Asbolus verrucosus]